MPYNQYGEYVDDAGFNPNPGSGMPSVSSDGGVLGPNGWSNQSFGRTVNDPRAAYVPLYDHTHMDEDAGFASQFQGARINPNSPQGANAMRFLQLQQLQNRQPNQNFQPPPGVYDFDPTKLFGASTNQAYGAVRGVSRGVGGAIDNVYTGHGSERLPEDPRILGLVPQIQRQIFGQGGPQFSRLGNQFSVNDGSLQNIPQGVDPDQYIEDHIAASPQPTALGQDQKVAAVQQFLQKKYASGELNAEQGSQIFTRLFGQDPISYAANQQKTREQTTSDNFKAAKEMQDKRDALLKERADLARQAGGLPEDILASVGKNPAGASHANEYFNPGVDMGVDPITGERKIEKSGWRGINPGTIARLTEIQQQLGMGNAPTVDSSAAMARIQRGKELETKAAQAQSQGDSGPSLSGWMQNPMNALQAGAGMNPVAGPQMAGFKLLQYLQSLGQVGGIGNFIQNAATNAGGGISNALGTIPGYLNQFTGAQ